MIHSLVNTNRQNNLYYGHTSLCPLCHEVEETPTYVFTCTNPHAVYNRMPCFEELMTALQLKPLHL
jgi:hypothetical protein